MLNKKIEDLIDGILKGDRPSFEIFDFVKDRILVEGCGHPGKYEAIALLDTWWDEQFPDVRGPVMIEEKVREMFPMDAEALLQEAAKIGPRECLCASGHTWAAEYPSAVLDIYPDALWEDSSRLISASCGNGQVVWMILD